MTRSMGDNRGLEAGRCTADKGLISTPLNAKRKWKTCEKRGIMKASLLAAQRKQRMGKKKGGGTRQKKDAGVRVCRKQDVCLNGERGGALGGRGL